MNATPSCRTCVKFNKCLEATRYYPCREYRRIKFQGKVKENEQGKEADISFFFERTGS